MDINKLESIDKADLQSRPRREAPPKPEAERQERSRSPDRVSISDAARALDTSVTQLDAENDLEAVAEIDAQRLQAIREAIEDGTYHIDTERLAEAVLRLEDEIYG